MMSILNCSNIQNANANVDEYSFSGRKFECAGLTLKKLALEKLIDKEVAKAFNDNYIYIHDMDNYATGNHNCLFIDFKKLFTDGFATRNGDVRPPKSISTNKCSWGKHALSTQVQSFNTERCRQGAQKDGVRHG